MVALTARVLQIENLGQSAPSDAGAADIGVDVSVEIKRHLHRKLQEKGKKLGKTGIYDPVSFVCSMVFISKSQRL